MCWERQVVGIWSDDSFRHERGGGAGGIYSIVRPDSAATPTTVRWSDGRNKAQESQEQDRLCRAEEHGLHLLHEQHTTAGAHTRPLNSRSTATFHVC